MTSIKLLYQRSVPVTDKISVVIPSVGEVIDNEDTYYGLVNIMTASPIDMMVPLDDAGIDFTKISDYELFLLLFRELQEQDTSLLFGDLDLKKFTLSVNGQNGDFALIDGENGIRIDKGVYWQIAATLRKIHHLEKNRRRPANEEAKAYLLERARIKMARDKKRMKDSQLESLIIAMVNTEQFKYDFDSVRALSIFQFNESVRQIIKKVDYDNRMFGVYSGTISTKDLSQDDLNWLNNK